MIAPRPAEEECDAEVRREDQNRINQFARLNARLDEIRNDRAAVKHDLEGLDDASTELMMVDSGGAAAGGGGAEDDGDGGDPVVWLLTGEAFAATTPDDAVQYCESQVEVLQAKVDRLVQEEERILAEQAELKKILYGRFGKSINLESS